jgi:hypothetical protein
VAWVEADAHALKVRVTDSGGKLVDAFTLERRHK